MFTRLRLTRFKAWQATGDIRLRPVTVLLGTNSSGKSSLIQSLLLLKQTVHSPDRSVQLNLGGDECHDLFDFGRFDDVLNQTAGGPRQFAIAFDVEGGPEGALATGGFDCSYGQTASGSVVIQNLSLRAGTRCFRAVRRERGAFSILVDDEVRPRLKGRHYAPERSIALPAAALAALGADGVLAGDLSLMLRRRLEQLCYLGPLRREPARDYLWNRTRPGELGSDGRGAVDALLASALLRQEGRPDVLAGVSFWLAQMGLADRLEVRPQGRSNRYALIVHRDGVACNLRDVGIGLSQVLPVLVAACFVPPGSTLLLEEPEIHLHPQAQAVLAELLVSVSRERQIQFVVETHSEHLFRRLQTLTARQPLIRHDVALYFAGCDGGAARLRPLPLDEFGRVSHWPEGFFGDALGETREQARLMFERLGGRPA